MSATVIGAGQYRRGGGLAPPLPSAGDGNDDGNPVDGRPRLNGYVRSSSTSAVTTADPYSRSERPERDRCSNPLRFRQVRLRITDLHSSCIGALTATRLFALPRVRPYDGPCPLSNVVSNPSTTRPRPRAVPIAGPDSGDDGDAAGEHDD